MTLAQAILFTRDVDRLQAFYTTHLGLAVISAEPGFVRLGGDGGAVLALHRIPAHIAGADTPGGRDDTYHKLCFRADDVDAARAALVAAGVPMRDLHRWGDVAYCDGIDPDGNVFQITTR